MASCPCSFCKASLAALSQPESSKVKNGEQVDDDEGLLLIDNYNNMNSKARPEAESISSLPSLSAYRDFLTAQLHSLMRIQFGNALLNIRIRPDVFRRRCQHRQTSRLRPWTRNIPPSPRHHTLTQLSLVP